MRFYNNKPKIGEMRVTKKFAFWPVKIGSETRFLENVEIKEIYTEDRYNDSRCTSYCWIPIEFLN